MNAGVKAAEIKAAEIKKKIESFSLDDRYTSDGIVLVSGIQALVRALQDRARLDLLQDLHTGGFVSGYRGSPLGGLDEELWAQAQRLEDLNIHFQPGVNEDLAATAVWGSQQVGLHQGAQVDGVFGLWYGKAPGLDRSCDAIRHANAWGTSPSGGVLLVVGDDPAAKSSSLATQSEFALMDMQVPVLAPADVQDVLDFAIRGWEMSRHAGVWVGLKALADHMDSAATIDADLGRYPALALSAQDNVSIRREDTPVAQEERLILEKMPAVLEFAAAAGINRQVGASGKAELGIVAAGKAYRDLREACVHLGLETEQDIAAAGIRIFKLGMTWPLDTSEILDFARASQALLILEEKRPFVEPQIKDILYGNADVPLYGKRECGLSSTGTLQVHDVVRVLCEKLEMAPPPMLEQHETSLHVIADACAPSRQERTPLFCAGCPHNTSTRVPEGSRATAGIGCHYMVQWMDRDTDSCTHMGGEGVTWVGESLFTDEPHIFANLGDGTYFHSGILAIRQAVAAGVNITYKVLYNDAVAMTGGQPTDGDLSVARMIAQLRAEGVERIVVVSDEPEAVQTGAGDIDVFHREKLDSVQRTLRDVAGVTVLIYQQTCATELRRRRKRGLVADERPRVFINEAVCDGCGDCSVQSGCVAVEPVVTDHGVKRQINQTSCNKDLSCATGFCPAFVEVEGELKKPIEAALSLDALREKAPLPETRKDTANILVTGVGGTGIVTLSALLAAAGRMEGREVRTLDMTGLAQKGGAVFGHVRIGGGSEALHSSRIPDGEADVLVGCDLVSAASNESLALMSPTTQAVINTHVTPTADFVLSQSHDVKLQKRLSRVRKLCGRVDGLPAEDQVAHHLGDAQQANVYLLGYAWQKGGIPLTLDSIEWAIELNGVAVERNLKAFHLGRLASMAPRSEGAAATGTEDVDSLVETNKQYLTAYHNTELAERYDAMVKRVAESEQAVRKGSERLTNAVARSYFKVLAVKDEYEVARLYSAREFRASIDGQFAEDARLTYLLAPPLLGNRKRRFGGWMRHAFSALAACRKVRNTWMDPFRFTGERKRSMHLIDHFEEVIERLLDGLNLQNLSIAVEIAKLPLKMRGFGHVKERQVDEALETERQLFNEFTSPPEPVTVFDPKVKLHDAA